MSYYAIPSRNPSCEKTILLPKGDYSFSMQSFIAIDYETANSDRRSACSLGVTLVENGEILKSYQSFIKPPEEFNYFDDFNVMLHGIKQRDVKNSPSFLEIWDELVGVNLKNLPLVCHNSGFDIRLTQDLLNHHGASYEDINFFDTLTIAKKLWPEMINHKLSTLARNFEITLDHHNAASDSEACARIALRQIQELKVNSLLEVAQNFGFRLGTLSHSGVKTMSSAKNYNYDRSKEQYSKSTSSKDVLPDREVIVDSDLFGAQIVFTGALQSMDRKSAIQIAVNNGAVVSSAVSKKTNLLIVGVSDFIDFSNGKKTRKLTDAESLKLQGQDISIIDEEEFLRMASY